MSTDPRIEGLARHFAESPAVFNTSPLYQTFGPAVAADATLLELMTRRRPGQQASFLLFGAVHRLLLGGADHRLRDYYPSVVGPDALDPAGAGPVFLEFCRDHHEAIEELIATRLVQSNVVRRAIGLRYALWAVARRWSGPVHLVEVGASAGLLLNVDRYGYLIGRQRFGPADAPVVLHAQWRGAGPVPDLDAVPPIAGRVGIDLNPIDLADEAERAWLRALIWPEQRESAALLDAAIDEMRAHPVIVRAGDAADVCRELGAELPAGQARVVFHAATRMHVPAERRRQFDEAIDSLGAGGPLFHVWLEPPNAPHHGFPAAEPGAIALHGPGDAKASVVVRVDGHLHWLEPLE